MYQPTNQTNKQPTKQPTKQTMSMTLELVAQRVEVLEKQMAMLLADKTTDDKPKKKPKKEKKADSDDDKPKKKRISGYILYSNANRDEVKEALAEKERQTVPLLGVATDRRALTHLGEVFYEDNVVTLICFVCGC